MKEGTLRMALVSMKNDSSKEFLFVPYESPILGQLLDLISPTKINLFEPRFKSYNPYNMAN